MKCCEDTHHWPSAPFPRACPAPQAPTPASPSYCFWPTRLLEPGYLEELQQFVLAVQAALQEADAEVTDHTFWQ